MTGELAPRRGTAGFAMFTLVLVAVCVGLGLWQLQRRVEKHALIAMLNERLAAAPVALITPRAASARASAASKSSMRCSRARSLMMARIAALA